MLGQKLGYDSSINSWDQMRQAFLARFFPPSKTAKLRDQITRLNQKDGESLYDAWERFKEMLRLLSPPWFREVAHSPHFL